MRLAPLLEVAPLVADRVAPFLGTRSYLATGALDDDSAMSPVPVTYEGRPSRADLSVQIGDVCFARMQSTRKVLGIEQQHAELILSTGFAVVRPNPREVEPEFLRHWLRSMQFQEAKDRLCSGATQKAITNERLAELTVPLPGLPDQQAIVRLLNGAEAAQGKRRAAMEELEGLPQSIFLNMFGDPVANPMHWSIRRFGDPEVGTLDRGVSRHRPRNDPALLDGPYPLVQTGDVANSGGYIRAYRATYSEVGLGQSKIWPVGTLCITIAANIAKTGILTFEACFPDSVVGFRSDDEATVEYVRVWLSFLQKQLEESAPESAQKNINLAILRELHIPLPPRGLRRSFAERMRAVERVRAIQGASAAELDSLTASLRHRAFSGEL